MNEATALKINGALCRVWMVVNVFGGELNPEDVAVLRGVTLAQAQTATEVVEAVNANAPSIEGEDGKKTRHFYCSVDSRALAGVLEIAQQAGGAEA